MSPRLALYSLPRAGQTPNPKRRFGVRNGTSNNTGLGIKFMESLTLFQFFQLQSDSPVV